MTPRTLLFSTHFCYTVNMSSDTQQKIELLKEYFAERPDVSMAFVFGSYAKNRQNTESDIDVAAYFTTVGSEINVEENIFFESEDEVWGDIEKIVGIRTDFLVLNRASASVAWSAINEGIPIVVKNRDLYLRFLLRASRAAEDWRETVRDFLKIKERSRSLSDTDRARLTKIIDFFESELADYDTFAAFSEKEYRTDAAGRRNIERWAENLVNASIDIAKIILASQKKNIPDTYREMLRELSFSENFSEESAEKLSSFVKLRNVLAHEYLDVRFYHIKKFTGEAKNVYGDLLLFAKNFLSAGG